MEESLERRRRYALGRSGTKVSRSKTDRKEMKKRVQGGVGGDE